MPVIDLSPALADWRGGHPSVGETAPAAPSTTRARGGASFGVTGRLVGLVLVPLLVMCGLAGREVTSRRATAATARQIDSDVETLTALVKLHAAIATEQSVASFYVRFEQLGVTPETASTYIGSDLPSRVAVARSGENAALDLLGSSSPVNRADVDALHRDVDRGVLSSAEAVDALRSFNVAVTGVVTRSVADLEVLGRRTNAGDLIDAVESLRLADSLIDVAVPEGIDLSALWFPSATTAPASSDRIVGSLAAERARYTDMLGELRALNVPAVVTRVNELDANRTVHAFDAAVEAAVRGELPTGVDAAVARIPDVFGGYLNRSTLLDDVVATATATVRTEARALAASEQRAFLLWAGLTAMFVIAALAIVVGFGRSIARPLRRLAGYAHAVNEGDFDGEIPDERRHGPREIQVAFSVFTDLVANLRLLDAKANALATCSFDDPVLGLPLPGRLGQSLESSVAVLSGSIVERDRLQTHLAYQATHDSLTGLANRPAAIVGIQDAIHRAARNGETMAVLFLDLNAFKSVNDSHGHEIGDAVLRGIAIRLTSCVRDGDVVARLGGDEFVIIAERLASPDAAMDLAKRVVDQVSKPMEVDQSSIKVGVAIGIAMTLDGPEEPLRLLARADAAMYRAKKHDRSAIEIFDAALQQHMVEREDIERALSTALADASGGGLVLHYQPVLQTDSGAVVGVEALIRWERPGHGLLAPDAFVPIAEATSLIIDLDRWVLAEASRQLLAWSDDPDLADVPIAVNISGRHLQSGQLTNNIAALLDTTGLAPHRLSIEITETVLLDDLVAAASELEAVRALGVRVAIDDFGTGYTSLAHLQHLPIDMIKIDRSFISELNQRRGSSLVRMVTDLGHAIDLGIIAEGVETDEELAALRAMGADQLQGFLLSRPLTEPNLKQWVHARTLVG